MLALFQHITTFILDVDGVLTDGTLLLLPNGEMARRMHIKDGYALQLAVKRGYFVAIISGGNSLLVQDRLEKLGIKDVFMGVTDKQKVLTDYLAEKSIHPDTVLYMGDDVPDLPALQMVGLPCCPADACTEVFTQSKYRSPLAGGAGCVRDVIEKTMRLQGQWIPDNHVTSR